MRKGCKKVPVSDIFITGKSGALAVVFKKIFYVPDE